MDNYKLTEAMREAARPIYSEIETACKKHIAEKSDTPSWEGCREIAANAINTYWDAMAVLFFLRSFGEKSDKYSIYDMADAVADYDGNPMDLIVEVAINAMANYLYETQKDRTATGSHLRKRVDG